MPNQPATPARTFRLSDESMDLLDRAGKALGYVNRSEALRGLIESARAATEAVKVLGEHTSEGLPLEAFAAAEQAAWLNVHMPTGEADRRLAMALNAAQPYIAAAERKRVLEDVVVRLQSFKADPAVITHFANLAEAADR